MIEVQNLIGGALQPAADGATTEIVDPATGGAYATAPLSRAADVSQATLAAATAFASWRRTRPAERQQALLGLADALEARGKEFVESECRNTGKPLELTAAEELPACVDQLRFFAGAARLLDGRASAEYLADHTSWVRREPVGVCAQITPWNYPLMMAVWKLAPALAAGNTVVLKPSDTTPVTSVMLVELAQQFFPSGVVNVVCGDRETGAALVADPVPAMISLTGSVAAGRAVAHAAATSLKRLHLELGGKAPAVVLSDADLSQAAEGISMAAYINAGQDCTAATRVIAVADVYDELLELLVSHADAARCGSPDEPDVEFGPLNNRQQLQRVEGFVQRLPAHARVLAGGEREPRAGFFFPATVVAGVRQDDEIVQDEVFGPVLTVQRAADANEAFRWANDSRYGLAASVWTRDHTTAIRASQDLEFGCVWVNTHIPFASEMPHGGFKESGYGKDLSVYGLEDYTRIKHVMTYTGS